MSQNKQEYKQRKKDVKRQYKADLLNLKHDYKLRKSDYKSQKRGYKKSDEYKIKASKNNGPRRSVLEEIGNAVTHGVGALFAITATFLMLLKCDSPRDYIATVMYGLGMFLTFLSSCLYHSFKFGTGVKRLFRRFDYLCIYLLIGSTFAPITLCFAANEFGTVFFLLQWIVILAGISIMAIFGPTKFRQLHFALYVVLGWSALMFLPQMIKTNMPLFAWILGGGLLYTIGLIPFKVDKRVMHFIWHFFVLFGAVVQWVGIYLYVY